jgi:flavin-dependent dehydrogenase
MTFDLRARLAALPEDQRRRLLQHIHEQSSASARSTWDVAILGGGPAGLTLALQLHEARPGTRILVAEKQRFPVPETTHKVGESTVEIAAHYLRDVIGMEDHLTEKQLRKFGLRMFFSDGENSDITRRIELGSTVFPPVSTYQLDRGRLENALYERARDRCIDVLDDAKVTEVRLQPELPAHRVTIDRDGVRSQISARWVVDASGRNRLLQEQLNLAKPVGHKANAAWFRVGHPIDIKEWTDDPAWQARVEQGDRALSTNHLMGPGYWVWLIRLATDSISIGIVADADQHPFSEFNRLDRALDWLARHEPQCADAVQQYREKIQDFRVMKNYAYSSEQVFSGEERWCLTGEAGVFLDPLYSPGLDLIAIGNGLVTDLVTRSLDGQDVTGRAKVHDQLFLNLAEIWLAIYEKQYRLMGNSQVMISKIIWDTAFYWGVFGHLFFHDRFPALVESPSVAGGLATLARLSNRVQAFFREWNGIDVPGTAVDFVDLYAPLNFMVELHDGLVATLGPGQFEARFDKNVRLFEQLAGQLISTVIEAYANDSARPHVLEQIQRWQTDPYVASLLAVYRRDRKNNPTNDGWLTLSSRRAEVLR